MQLLRVPDGLTKLSAGLAFGAALVALVCGCTDQGKRADFPNQPIKVIVPFSSGGASDAFARIIKQAIEENDLLPEPLVIVNVGGAGGTIGSRRVKDARPDGYTVLLLHDAIVMAKHSGKVYYGPEAFEPVAGTSQNGTVIAVREDSPYANLQDLADDAKLNPNTITFGCNLGTPTHFVGLLLEREQPGAAFRFVQTGDGAQRFNNLKGGHIDLTVFSNQEFLQFRTEGIRALAYLSDERHPSMADVRTAVEQGLEVRAGIMHYWWMPKGTPPDRAAVMADALEKAMQTEVVQEWLAEIQSDPDFVRGPELAARIQALDEKVSSIDLRESVDMPNLPLIIFVGIAIFGVAAVVRTLRGRARASKAPTDESSPARYGLAILCALLACAYVVALGLDFDGFTVGFRGATFVFVMAIGMCLAGGRLRAAPWVVALAAAMAVGLHFLFTRVFVIDLP